MLCPIKVHSNKFELTVPTSCYWVVDLPCVNNEVTQFFGLPYPLPSTPCHTPLIYALCKCAHLLRTSKIVASQFFTWGTPTN